jgi:hypothetical protein
MIKTSFCRLFGLIICQNYQQSFISDHFDMYWSNYFWLTINKLSTINISDQQSFFPIDFYLWLLKKSIVDKFQSFIWKIDHDRSKKLIIDNFIDDCYFLNLFQTFNSFFDLSFHNTFCKDILWNIFFDRSKNNNFRWKYFNFIGLSIKIGGWWLIIDFFSDLQ